MDFKEKNEYKIKLREFLPEYLRLKGINHKKFFRCFSPDHEDKNPSMTYYNKAKKCTCFACGIKYDIFQVIGLEYGLSLFNDQFKKVKELYENKELIKDANETIYSKKNTEVILEKESKKINNIEKKETLHYSNTEIYFFECKKRMKNCNYLINRGISIGIIDYFNIGYDPNYNAGKGSKWKAIIFPTDYNFYTARCIEEKKYQKVGNSRLSNPIFNYREIALLKEIPFFVVEGEIDSLSIAEVGGRAIALGSKNFKDHLVERLEKDKPQNTLYLMLDNDKWGKKAQLELYMKLKEIGLNVYTIDYPSKYKDPNEYLLNDRNKLEVEVRSSNLAEDLINYVRKDITVKQISLDSFKKNNVDKESIINFLAEKIIKNYTGKEKINLDIYVHEIQNKAVEKLKILLSKKFDDYKEFVCRKKSVKSIKIPQKEIENENFNER